MWYLFLQIWLWLVLAFVLGWFAHWLLCCRGDDQEGQAKSSEGIEHVRHHTAPEPTAASAPPGFASRPEQIDDLKQIKGVGAVIEETLQGLGIYHFSQIAEWNEQQVEWVETHLSFPGRIGREDWCGQAASLSRGESTEFASRVEAGEVDYE